MNKEQLIWPISAIILLSFMGLLGYLPGLGLLGSVKEDYIPMAPSTAICFIVLSIILKILSQREVTKTQTLFLLIVTLSVFIFGVLEVAEYFTAKDLNFENRIVPSLGLLNGVPIARMSPVTGLAFAFSGASVFCLIIQQKCIINNKLLEYSIIIPGLLTLLIGFIFTLAYLYGVPLLYQNNAIIPMALTTAICFILFSFILVSFNKDFSLPQLFLETSTRSYLLRFFLPFTIFSIVLSSMVVVYSVQTYKTNPVLVIAALTVLSVISVGAVATFLSRYMGNIIDRTKAAELKAIDELKESEKRFGSVFSQTFQFAGIVKLDGTLVAANRKSLEFIGASESDVIGKPFWETPWWRHSEELRSWLKKAIRKAATGEIVRNAVTHFSSQDDVHYFDFSLKPVVNDNGAIEYLIPESRDITELKHTIDELKRKENTQREILNFMTDSVISIDQAGKILTYNKASETLFGYTPEEMIGTSINQLMPEYHATRHNDYMKHFIESGDPKIIGIGREVEGLSKNGNIFPIHISVAELPEDADGIRRFIGSCHDLTQQKEHQEHIRRIQKMDALGKLAGGIAHDYNNMLGVVLGYASLLEDALEKNSKLATYAHQIHHAGDRGAKLTRKLLSYSKHVTTNEQSCDVNTLLREEQHMLEKTLTARIKLLFDLQKDLWSVWIDDGDFEDAVLNLSINAMHAMDSDGELTIQTRNYLVNQRDADELQIADGEYIKISVTDTGCGMDEKTRENIFNPFFTTKGDKGTGLGLSQVYEFVKHSGGSINVTSAPLQGTRFEIYLPRYVDGVKNTFKDEVKSINLRGNESILIVDDEPSLLLLTNERLSQMGYKTFCASNAKEAIELLEHESIDLLFSDVIMPDKNGYELAEFVKEKYPSIKIQLTSGFENKKHIKSVANTWHQNILYKPFDKKLLLKKIRELLDK